MNKALYRTMRPLSFSEVRDQELPVQVLKNQLKTNTVSHGYLFCGSRGTGKTSCAKILARAVNCLQPKDGEPCNQCANCKEILEERAVDVLELDAASNNGVDNIRELKNMGVYPPAYLKKKVYIIDEAHMLSTAAFNALLKILEEPPQHLIFILATTDPEKLPDTVKSRLQRFDFHAISKRAIEQTLRDVVKKLEEDVDPSVYGLIANHARGALRDALSLLDQLLALPMRPVSVQATTELLGVTPVEELMPILHGLLTDHGAEIFQASGDLVADGKQPDRILLSLMEVLRDLFMEHHGLGEETPHRESLEPLLSLSEPRQILHILDRLRDLLNEIQYAFDPGLIFQVGLATAGLPSEKSSKDESKAVWQPLPKTSFERKEIPSKPKEIHEPEYIAQKTKEQTPPLSKDAKEAKKEGGEVKKGDIPPMASFDDSHGSIPEELLLGFGPLEPLEPIDTIDTIDTIEEEELDGKVHSVEENLLNEEPIDGPEGEPTEMEESILKKEVDQQEEEDGPKVFSVEDCEDLTEEECENEGGREFLLEMMKENPLLLSLGEDYWVKLEDNVLTFTKRFPEITETLLESYKEDIREKLKELLGRKDVFVVARNMNPIIDELTKDFGNRLSIKE